MSIFWTSIIVATSILLIIFLTSRFKLEAFFSLFVVSVLLAVILLPPGKIVSMIQQGFGNTMASIGLLIILGAIIGITLDKTGGTLSIAKYILSKTGEKRTAAALGITGFITGLPIFCNAGFIILSGLSKSLSARSKLAMPFMATVLGCSLYSVHCLIPPHPGVLAAAGVIKVNTGYLIIAGTFAAIPGAVAAFYWGRFMASGHDYKPEPENSSGNRSFDDNLPSAFISILPIAIPLLLISLRSVIAMIDKDSQYVVSKVIMVAGEPVMALFAGVLLAMLLLKQKSVQTLNGIFNEAVIKAGPILIVTAAGGMFGMVIQATGTGEAMGKLLAGTTIGLLVPFLIAVVMKTAQGSSTVAIITTASFVAPMIGVLGLDSEWGRILAMLSMGAGSMVVSHANDSYFWVVTNFSGIDTDSAIRVYTSSTLVMGLVVFICVWLASLVIL
jgi:gluconate:H+ symporter, GntP family